MKVYGIPTCGSVKKAIKFFKDNHIAYEFIDFKKVPATSDMIDKWLTKIDIKTLLNTKGTKYKTLKLKDMNLDENGQKVWMAKENLIIKRPVIEIGDELIVAYDEEVYKAKFL